MPGVTATLDWRGKAVLIEAKKKVARALNDTGADAVTAAQVLAPRLTGFMANTIEIVKYATENELRCVWGNVTADYTLWQEIGSQGRAGRYFLRGGAERAYPGLKKRLAKIGG